MGKYAEGFVPDGGAQTATAPGSAGKSTYAEGFEPDPDPVLEEMHPGISRWERAKILNLAPSSAVAARALREKGFQVEDEGDFNLKVRKPGERVWRRLDPKGFDWQDPLDILGDIGSGIAAGAGAVLGAGAGAPAGPGGALAGSAAGAGLGAAAASGVKSIAGSALGLPTTGEESLGQMAGEGLTAGAVQGVLGPAAYLGGKAVRAAGPKLSSLLGTAGAGTLGAAKGAVKAVPAALKEGAKGAAEGAIVGLPIPGLGSALGAEAGGVIRGVRPLAKGAAAGWREGVMGRSLKTVGENLEAAPARGEVLSDLGPDGLYPTAERLQRVLGRPTEEAAGSAAKEFQLGSRLEAAPERGAELPGARPEAVEKAFGEGMSPSEVLVATQIAPEELALRPAVQETAKKALAGEQLSEFEQGILGRAIDIARGRVPELTPGERYLEHVYWKQGAAGKNPQAGDKFGIEFTHRRASTTRDIGAGGLDERFVRLRPGFMTREEVRANAADLSDQQLREMLRDEWGIKGGRPGTGLDQETKFLAPVPSTQTRIKGDLRPLEELGRGDLEELLFRVQPDTITVGKGGAYDPRRYKLTRFVDTEKAEPFGGMSKDELVNRLVKTGEEAGKSPAELQKIRERAVGMNRLELRDQVFGPEKAKQMGLQSSSKLGSWISTGLDETKAVRLPTYPEGPAGPVTWRRVPKEELESLGQEMFGGKGPPRPPGAPPEGPAPSPGPSGGPPSGPPGQYPWRGRYPLSDVSAPPSAPPQALHGPSTAPPAQDLATSEIEKPSWREFVKARMGPAMEETGSHGAAMKQISAEWKARGAAPAAAEAAPQHPADVLAQRMAEAPDRRSGIPQWGDFGTEKAAGRLREVLGGPPPQHPIDALQARLAGAQGRGESLPMPGSPLAALRRAENQAAPATARRVRREGKIQSLLKPKPKASEEDQLAAAQAKEPPWSSGPPAALPEDLAAAQGELEQAFKGKPAAAEEPMIGAGAHSLPTLEKEVKTLQGLIASAQGGPMAKTYERLLAKHLEKIRMLKGGE